MAFSRGITRKFSGVAAASLEAPDAALSLVDSDLDANEDTADRFAALRVVGEHSSDLIVVIDGAGLVTYANPTALEIFGISPDQGIGADAFTYVHSEDLARVTQRFIELLATPGATIWDTVRASVGNDVTRELELVATNHLDVPDVAGIVVNGRDVTESKAFAAETASRERWFTTLLSNSSDFNGIVDANGIVTYVGPSNERLGGFGPDERIGHSVLDLLHPEDYYQAAEMLRESILHEGSSGPFVVRAETSSSSWRFFEVMLTNCLNDPAIEGVIYNVRDVTDLKLAEQARGEAELSDIRTKLASAQAIADSEERFRLAFECNMAPMLFTDLEDRVIAANDAFCEMVGYTREELLHCDSKQFTHRDDVGVTEEAHRRISKGTVDQVRYVKRYCHKNGRTIVAEVLKSPARDVSGNLLYFVISEHDITAVVQRDRTLQLLGAVNKLAMFATEERVFFQELCDILVEVGGYKLAWIGLPTQSAEGAITPAYSSGATEYLIDESLTWWGTSQSAQGPTGKALQSGIAQIHDDLTSHFVDESWRLRAIEFGFGSMAAIPSVVGDQHGILAIYSGEKFTFDDVTVNGLEEVVREIRLAVAHVRSVRQTTDALRESNEAMEALRLTEHALSASEERFRLAFEGNMAPMLFLDLNDRATAVNDAFCTMLGRTRDEILAYHAIPFTHPDDLAITEDAHRNMQSGGADQIRYIKRYVHRDGHTIIVEASKYAARDAEGAMLYSVMSVRDVTQERELLDQLERRALHDPLTGLANHALFQDRLSRAHSQVQREGGLGAVLVLDLDDFKGVNDTHGHLVGDELLKEIARRFALETRGSDTLCRFGGDEFLYLAEGIEAMSEVIDLAQRLIDALADPITFAGVKVAQRVSVGVVIWDATSMSERDLLQNADIALNEAKNQGKGRFVIFTPSMHARAANRFTLVQELRHALENGEIAMYYQPIVNLATTEVVGFEALMRWTHRERGPISPGVFIPLAEENGLIVELGAFALREACAAARSWQSSARSMVPPYVSVNLSAHQFHDPRLIERIEAALLDNHLSPDQLIIEITESAALLNVTETMNVLEQLRRLGVGIALDDFGTGYSSLAYLLRLRPKILKIDQSFVRPNHESSLNTSLLETIVSLGKKLEMTMLAEGIETSQQYEQLRDLNCDLGQGFLWSPAIPCDEAAALVGLDFRN